MTTTPAPPPQGLRSAGKALWRSIAEHWAEDDLTPDARELRTLADTCREADTLAALEGELTAAEAEGRMIVKGSQGQPVAHPFVSEARSSRAAIRTALFKLGMDVPEESAKVSDYGRSLTVAEAGRLGGQAKRRNQTGA